MLFKAHFFMKITTGTSTKLLGHFFISENFVYFTTFRAYSAGNKSFIFKFQVLKEQ